MPHAILKKNAQFRFWPWANDPISKLHTCIYNPGVISFPAIYHMSYWKKKCPISVLTRANDQFRYPIETLEAFQHVGFQPRIPWHSSYLSDQCPNCYYWPYQSNRNMLEHVTKAWASDCYRSIVLPQTEKKRMLIKMTMRVEAILLG